MLATVCIQAMIWPPKVFPWWFAWGGRTSSVLCTWVCSVETASSSAQVSETEQQCINECFQKKAHPVKRAACSDSAKRRQTERHRRVLWYAREAIRSWTFSLFSQELLLPALSASPVAGAVPMSGAVLCHFIRGSFVSLCQGQFLSLCQGSSCPSVRSSSCVPVSGAVLVSLCHKLFLCHSVRGSSVSLWQGQFLQGSSSWSPRMCWLSGAVRAVQHQLKHLSKTLHCVLWAPAQVCWIKIRAGLDYFTLLQIL